MTVGESDVGVGLDAVFGRKDVFRKKKSTGGGGKNTPVPSRVTWGGRPSGGGGREIGKNLLSRTGRKATTQREGCGLTRGRH